MKRAAFLSSAYMAIGNGLQFGVSLVAFLYLARVLEPAEFGAMALAAALVDLLTPLCSFGQVEALLHKGADSQPARSTSWWLLVASGLLFSLGIAAVAPAYSRLFDTQELLTVLLVLVPIPLVWNLGQVSEALLRSRLNYAAIALRQLIAAAGSAIVAVYFASKGMGVYALAAQKLSYTVFYTAVVLLAQPWAPSAVFCPRTARRLFSDGANISVGNTLQLANGRLVDFTIGYFLGVVALGFARIARRLHEFLVQGFIGSIASVSISSFVQRQGDPQRFRSAYLSYLQMTFLLCAPVFLGLAAIAPDTVAVAAGERWRAAGPILALLSIGAVGSCVTMLFPPVMIAAARSHVLRRQAISQTIFTVIASLVAARWGMLAIIGANVLRIYVFAGINISLMNKALNVRLRDVASAMAPPVISAAMMAGLVFTLFTQIPDMAPIARVALLIAAGAAAFPIVLFAGDLGGLWRGYLNGVIVAVRPIFRTAAPAAPPAS